MKTLILLSIILASCSIPKRAQRHYNKAVKLGVEIKCDTTYIDVPVIVKGKDGKDSIIYEKTPCNCPEVKTQPTNKEIKWKYKYMAKRERDSLKHVENLLKERNNFLMDSLENDRKVRKIDSKVVIKQENNDRKENTQWSRMLTVAFWFGILLAILFCLGKFIAYFKNFLK